MAIEHEEAMKRYQDDLSKVITRCYSNSISPEKWLSFVRQTKRKHFTDSDSQSSDALDALLARMLLSHILASAPPPSLLLQYLRSAILGFVLESSHVDASENAPLISSKDALLYILSACASSHQVSEDGESSALQSSPQPASVEAVCVELESMGFLIALDSAEVLLQLYRTIQSNPEAMPSHRSNPALLLVKSAASLFQISFSQSGGLLSRTLAIQIISGPGHRALSRQVLVPGINGENRSELDGIQESSGTLAVIEKSIALCQEFNLEVEASSLLSIRNLLTNMGANSSSNVQDSTKVKQNDFHPDLKVPLSNQWANSSALDNLLGSDSVINNVKESQLKPGSEALMLLQLFVSNTNSFDSKAEAASALLRTQMSGDIDFSLVHTRFYLSLLLETSHLLEATEAQKLQDPTKEPFTPGGTRPLRFGSEGSLWIDVLCGFLPELIGFLESERSSASVSSEIGAVNVGKAVKVFFDCQNEMLSACEIKLALPSEISESQMDGDVSMNDLIVDTDSQPHRPIRAFLIQSLQELHLIDQELVDQLSGDNEVVAQDLASLTPSLRSEAASSVQAPSGQGSQLQSHISELLSTGEFAEILDRIASDYGAHRAFVIQLSEVFSSWSSSSEPQLDSLSRICKGLGENSEVLDAIFLYLTPRSLLGSLASLFDREDLGQLSDEPLTHGGILLFIQLCIRRYKLHENLDWHLGGSRFLPRFLRSASAVHVLSSLPSEEQSLIGKWITALFDSEGISDELIRASSPQTLLRLAPTLASQCIRACASGIIDLDTLKSGLTYFCNPILSWTLPGVLSRLLNELASQPGFSVSTSISTSNSQHSSSQTLRVAPRDLMKRKVLLETLCMLLVNEGCPSLALQFASKDVPNVIVEAEPLSSEMSEGGISDLSALKMKSEGFVGMRLDPTVSINRLLKKRFPSVLVSSLSSTSSSSYQDISSQLISPTFLKLPPPQILDTQKSFVSKLIFNSSNSLYLLKDFIQSVHLEDNLKAHSISSPQFSLASSQSIAQTLILAFELGEKLTSKDQLIALGEVLALRLWKIHSMNKKISGSNSIPLVAQALLFSSSFPDSIVQPLKVVFPSSSDS